MQNESSFFSRSNMFSFDNFYLLHTECVPLASKPKRERYPSKTILEVKQFWANDCMMSI